MKNIHVLPTDNYKEDYKLQNSDAVIQVVRLGQLIFDSSLKEFRINENKSWAASCDTDVLIPHNIYITSNEEIKIKDYAYHKVFGVGKIINIDGVECFVTIKRKTNDGSATTPWKRNIPDIKKIILTTDQDLIKDKVERINDEFIEWFVKNPSCEFIEVENKDMFYDREYWHTRYKIIIPKEEPKQETTLEKAKKYAELSYYGDEVDAFVRGVKWQQEQDLSMVQGYLSANLQNIELLKKMYSEDDLKQLEIEELKKWKEEALIAHEINQKVIEKLMDERKLMYNEADMIKFISFVGKNYIKAKGFYYMKGDFEKKHKVSIHQILEQFKNK